MTNPLLNYQPAWIYTLLLALYRYTLYNLGMSQPLQLFRLQQVDTQLDQVRARLSEIEAVLEDDSALRQAENKVASNVEARENAQRELDRAEEEVQAQQSKIDNNQKTLYSGAVKNPKELEDLQNEAGALKRHLGTLEERQLENMIALEDAADQLQTARQELETLKQHISEQNVELSGEQKVLLAEVDKLENDRIRLVNGIDDGDMALYTDLRHSGMGLAVAEVMERCCSACGATLTAAQAQAARSPSAITCCDTCGRILYSG